MRILVLHSRYQSGPVSGENRVVQDEVQLLTDAGHQVSLWAPESFVAGSLLKAGISAVWSRSAESEVRRLVKEQSSQVVHCHNLIPALSPAVITAASQAGAAVVMTLHNYRLLCLPATFLRDGEICEDCQGKAPWRGVLHRCYRGSMGGSGALAASLMLHRQLRTFERVARFLAVSRFVRIKHIEGGFPEQQIRVKPNFVWPGTRRTGAGDYFLYLGRLSHEKGVATLLQAWPGLKVPLLVAGDGPDRAALEEMAPRAVRFLGSVDPSKAMSLISGARALLMPSIWYEGAPRSALEAFSSGVPVLASDIGALPDTIDHGVSGLLLPPADPAAWAEGIRRLLLDREADCLGRGAWEAWSARYSPNAGLRDLEEAYEDAISSRSGPSLD
jgi:glycosyltransferase involved in cell wall biosynthesis